MSIWGKNGIAVSEGHKNACYGPDEKELKDMVSSLGLDLQVIFTGRHEPEDIYRFYKAGAVFVCASEFETQGLTYIEAMACGLPIIMTKTNAWELLAVPETGVAVEIDDPEALTAAMLEMMEQYDRYDPERISAWCRSRFSEEAVAAELTELYQSVVNKK